MVRRYGTQSRPNRRLCSAKGDVSGAGQRRAPGWRPARVARCQPSRPRSRRGLDRSLQIYSIVGVHVAFCLPRTLQCDGVSRFYVVRKGRNVAKSKIGLLAKSAAAAAALCLAAPGGALAQHQEILITPNTPGLTSGSSQFLFGGGGPRNYVAVFFTPRASGSYIFGQSQSTIDSVIEVYRGSFNPNSNSNVLLGSDDDGYASATYVAGSV